MAPGPPRGRGPRPPRSRFRGPGNLTPLLRLIALIGLAILVVVLLVVWVEGCASDRKRDRYSSYMTEIGQIGNDVREIRRGARHDADDRRAQAGGPRREARWLRPAGRDPDAESGRLCIRLDLCTGERGCRRCARAPGDRSERATSSVPGNRGRHRCGSRSGCNSPHRCSASRRATSCGLISSGHHALVVLDEEGIEGVPGAVVRVRLDGRPHDRRAHSRRCGSVSRAHRPAARRRGCTGAQIAYVKALPSGQPLSTTTETTIKVYDSARVRGRCRGLGRRARRCASR